jgi:RNA polymerase II subunit A C-terminal domain phosphatase SSU72
MPRLKFAMVCYSNQNRSMEAHKVFADAGLDVESYGVGTCVRLPGPNRHEPNMYEFGTPYKAILADLRSKPARDQPHYERLGLISMLERNLKVKNAPEKWQRAAVEDVDVVITFETTIMDTLLEDMLSRESGMLHPVLVVNLEVTDNNKEALLAAPQVRGRPAARVTRVCMHGQCCRSMLQLAQTSVLHGIPGSLVAMSSLQSDEVTTAPSIVMASSSAHAGFAPGAVVGAGGGLDGQHE